MKRTAAIAACGLSLSACSGLPSLPTFSLPGAGPAATTVQFESEPAGAEARTSTGQTCRTPCAQAIAANEFTVTFTQAGYQPQTVPVRISASTEMVDPNTGQSPSPRLVPNPVYVELQPAAPPPPAAKKRPQAPKRQQPVAARQPAPAPAPAAPAPAPAAAWPPPPGR